MVGVDWSLQQSLQVLDQPLLYTKTRTIIRSYREFCVVSRAPYIMAMRRLPIRDFAASGIKTNALIPARVQRKTLRAAAAARDVTHCRCRIIALR